MNEEFQPMAEERICSFSDLPKDTCAHCTGDVSAEDEAAEEGRVTGGIFGKGGR